MDVRILLLELERWLFVKLLSRNASQVKLRQHTSRGTNILPSWMNRCAMRTTIK